MRFGCRIAVISLVFDGELEKDKIFVSNRRRGVRGRCNVIAQNVLRVGRARGVDLLFSCERRRMPFFVHC